MSWFSLSEDNKKRQKEEKKWEKKDKELINNILF